jgi:hypothetical protein
MATKSVPENGQQTIEQLQQRYQRLNTQKIQAETKLEEAKKQLDKLKSEARQSYGTDDVTELKKKLQEMKDENERRRAAYQADLEKIESDLAAVEQRFALAQSDARGTE